MVESETGSRSKQKDPPSNEMDDENGDRKRPNVRKEASTFDLRRSRSEQ
jgi:hypothetical protein